ncbi:hypothetical protein ABS71_01315 [bacterium SCN 62-11]|nr:PAS domain S-box protein [Candidatus Eremiobacteraeota bacterium]ODT79094.1 MAG: hypothetical protein ABS71_01315 [bacterium SCN 62-11]
MKKTTSGGPEALLRSLRQVGRALLRQDDSLTVVRQTVTHLSELGGLETARLVHWNGTQALASASLGSIAEDTPLPACLRAQGSCQGCTLQRARVESHTLIPLRGETGCRGALLVDAVAAHSEELELLSELGEDLGLKLERLQRRRTLQSRDEIRREVEKLGSIGGWEFDPATGEGDWTEEVARIHDLDPDSPIDKNTGLNYYHPESRPLIEQAVSRCLQGGEGYDLEARLVSAKGVVKWVRALGAPVIQDGKVVLVRGLMQDISARKAAEARAQAIFDDAGIGLAECHAETGRYHRVNRKLCEILGYTADELLSKTWGEVTHPDDLMSDKQRESDLQQGLTKLVSFEKRYVHKDGSAVWVRVTVASKLDDGYFITTVEDIGDRRKVWIQVREQKQRLRDIFDWMQAGVMVVRLSDRNIVDVNPMMEKLVGWSSAEMLGATALDLNLFENPEDVFRLRAELARTGSLQPAECRVRRKDGGTGDFLLTGGVAQIEGEECAIVIWHDLSQLRQADAALRQSESELRVMFEMAPVGIAQADPATGLILSANERYCAITGYTADELRGMTVAQLSHPEDNLRLKGNFTQAVREERPEFHVDKRYLRKDGSVAWVRVDVSILRDDQGNPTRTLAVIEDVSARIHSETRLREAEQRSRVALDAAGQGTMKRDLTNDMVELDFQARQHFELGESRVPISQLFARVHPEDLPTATSTAAHVSDKGVYQCDLRVLLPHGGVRWLSIHGRALYDSTGQAFTSITTTLDISQAKAAEQALRASQERYQALVDHLEDVIFSLDSQLRIAFVNPSVRRLGYSPEELQGRHILRLIPKEDRARLRLSPLPSEWRLLDKNGKVRWFRINIGLQPDHKTISGVAVDVSQQKATEEQLVAAQKMEAIGRLAGGVAHDFNNLLTVILSYTELSMEEIASDDPIYSDLQEVLDAGERAKSLTRQLLAFSRRQVMCLESLDLNALVNSVERMLKRLIGEDIALQVEPAATIWPVRADRSQLEQVLLNLAVNARDAMPNGGTLQIDTSCQTLSAPRAATLDIEAGEYCCISVRDSGCGMSEEVLSNLFEPFFTTKEAGKGTGLGLSMVYGIVRQSSGAVEVESQPGQGSCFHVYLPACPETAPDQRPLRQNAPTRGGSETLLVVEDEPALLQLARRTLSACGYEVLCAPNGAEALLLAEQSGKRIDLVLSDVVMPGMNGPDLLVRLRPLCPEARFLLMSGYSHDSLSGRGVYDQEILTKPFDAPTLRAAVRTRLDSN